jgi:cytochrome c-type biogenesis protein CcmE
MKSFLKTGIQGRGKFILGGIFILAAVIFLIISSTRATAEDTMTVDEINAMSASKAGRNLRTFGAVVGSTIKFNPDTNNLTFDIANVPGDNTTITAQGGLAYVLHNAVTDPTRRRLHVIYNGPKPDLMRDEAQAIITGHLGEDGVFHADELLLKCPTKYEQAVPSQATGNK